MTKLVIWTDARIERLRHLAEVKGLAPAMIAAVLTREAKGVDDWTFSQGGVHAAARRFGVKLGKARLPEAQVPLVEPFVMPDFPQHGPLPAVVAEQITPSVTFDASFKALTDDDKAAVMAEARRTGQNPFELIATLHALGCHMYREENEGSLV